MRWDEALALVFKGRLPKEIAPIVGVTPEAVRGWLRGESVPCGWRWLALVEQAKLGDRWPELSAARDAVARKPTGRRRLSDEESVRRHLARRKSKTQGAVSPSEVQREA